jgi:molecular chaperone DnaJ
MQTQSVCPTCQGEGRIIKDKCTHCGGEGTERGDKIVEVKIPAGVSEGMALTLQGMGNAARHGGINGDLIVVIKEEEHADFERSGNNLVHNLRISVTTAILGGDAEVPTIDGRVRISIDAGTQSGKVMRLRGKGLPDVNGRGRGDIIIVVDVVIPTELTKEERKLVEQLSEQPNFKQTENKQDQDILSRMKNFFR